MSTPTTEEAQPCECGEPDGYCDACDDAHGHTCIICGQDFCTPCWETDGHNDDCKRSVMADGSIAAALTTEEARELARQWARNVAAGGGVDGLNGKARYQLLTWVLAYAGEASAEGLDAADITANLAIELNLGTGETFDEDAARALLLASGRPSSWTA